MPCVFKCLCIWTSPLGLLNPLYLSYHWTTSRFCSILQVPAKETLPARLRSPSQMLVLPYCNNCGPQCTLILYPKCLWESCLPAKNSTFVRARINSASHYHGRVEWDEGLLVQPLNAQRASNDIIINYEVLCFIHSLRDTLRELKGVNYITVDLCPLTRLHGLQGDINYCFLHSVIILQIALSYCIAMYLFNL